MCSGAGDHKIRTPSPANRTPSLVKVVSMSSSAPRQESTTTLAHLVELVTHLGSPYTIAGYLEGLGIRGHRYRSEDSALARWIRWETGAVRCEIDPWEIAIMFADERTVCEYAPEVIGEFERCFDRGEFPNLVSAEVVV